MSWGRRGAASFSSDPRNLQRTKGTAARACSPSIREVEAGRSEVQDQLWLQSESETKGI